MNECFLYSFLRRMRYENHEDEEREVYDAHFHQWY